MLSRYSPSRCCCPKPEIPNPCPCFKDTLATDANLGIVVSDFVMSDASFVDINGSFGYPMSQIVGCSYEMNISDPQTLETFDGERWYFLHFTRLTTWGVFNFAPESVTLSAGVKAVIVVAQRAFISTNNIFATAIFEKVLVDVDGFVDCSVAITSGFSFVGERNTSTIPGGGIFDPTGGTVSYSPLAAAGFGNQQKRMSVVGVARPYLRTKEPDAAKGSAWRADTGQTREND